MTGDQLPRQFVSGALVAVATYTRSWDFDPREAGRRAVTKHADALRRLADAT